MHVQIITFNLKDIGVENYLWQVEWIAPAFAGLPGLISKTWLANAGSNTYGGVYLWADREAMEVYRETDIHKGVLANPRFETSRPTTSPSSKARRGKRADRQEVFA